jgi:hypothetical protein
MSALAIFSSSMARTHSILQFLSKMGAVTGTVLSHRGKEPADFDSKQIVILVTEATEVRAFKSRCSLMSLE